MGVERHACRRSCYSCGNKKQVYVAREKCRFCETIVLTSVTIEVPIQQSEVAVQIRKAPSIRGPQVVEPALVENPVRVKLRKSITIRGERYDELVRAWNHLREVAPRTATQLACRITTVLVPNKMLTELGRAAIGKAGVERVKFGNKQWGGWDRFVVQGCGYAIFGFDCVGVDEFQEVLVIKELWLGDEMLPGPGFPPSQYNPKSSAISNYDLI